MLVQKKQDIGALKNKINIVFYIADWFSKRESIGYFYARISENHREYPLMGRKGSEFYAIYRTRSRAESEADGLADVPEKL